MTLRDSRWYIAATAIGAAVLAVTLHVMGRIPLCTCGFGVWTADAWSNETSQLFADPYSSSHVLHGIIFYAVLWLFRKKVPLRYRFLIALLVEIGWEILENSPLIINRYRSATASLDYTGDSILNAVGDTLFAMLGFWFAAKVSWKWTLTFFVGIELLLLWTIRDNLTLNVLMLISPIQEIREWQQMK